VETEGGTETTTETSTQVGITEAQLKEALTKFFYAKVGVTYTPPTESTSELVEEPAPTTSTEIGAPSVDSSSGGADSGETFTAVA
jgi:hypothetical protein